MASFHNARGFRGNQGEDEDVDVISMEPITMIVPLELQDSPRTATSERSTSLSATEGAEEVGCSAPVASVAAEVVVFEGWEGKVLSGRLDNLHKAPKTLLVGFKFRAVLHHKVADGAATVKGYKKLEEMVRRFQIPRTILIRAGTPNERACSVSRMGWVPVYIDHFDISLRFPLPGLIFDVLVEYELALSQLTPNSIKFIIGFMLLCERLGLPAKAVVFRSLFLCRLCPSTSGTRWYYISGREKMMIFTNIRNKVARWKRQFVFVRDTRTERIKPAARLREGEGVGGFGSLGYPGADRTSWVCRRGKPTLSRGNANKHKARGTGELGPVPNVSRALTSGRLLHWYATHSAGVPARHKGRVPSKEMNTGSEPAPGTVTRPASMPQALAREIAEAAPASSSVAGPRIAYPNGFSYARTECQAAMLQGMQNFVPPADRLHVKGHVQQYEGHAALIKLMDAFSYTVALFECEQGARTQNNELQQNCKQLASKKASLTDEVGRLHSSEMANRAMSAESRANELARKVDELKEEPGRAEERARKAESEREKTLHELSTLRERVSQADQHVARVEASLESTKRLHQRDVCFAHAQGAEWLVGAEMFQDTIAVASANTTTDIFNEVRGMVLQVRADFPIGELAFFEGEEINEERRSLAQPANTRVRLRWELNEEGLPVWPPSVIEEGEDTEGLPSFDPWVANPHDVLVEPSSTPPSAQPQPAPVAASALSPALPPPDQPSPARSTLEPNNASIPIDLTDD
ncbi:hypothetical protein SLEP1_g45379 [Rubroshorea leprosula]|uniref:Transposase (putative) gypsy type domain-containing protein n=1 Tax=Rubroshorea leprosula TaxID=152421 RepID=A0AAV5LIZ2_9ROSI|nr:hypothetical protein SLEP1_g45379 [Rubroshorea leprosula]